MEKEELKNILDQLLKFPSETEWFERKEARAGYDFNKLGKYFSAISNESNLHSRECGWIIFGVNDTNDIVGTAYRKDRNALDHLKHEIAQQTSYNITFTEIFELENTEGRVIMFRVPPATKGIPVAWKGHYYGRDGQSLVPLRPDEYERIRYPIKQDWSAKICEKATINDLDPDAIKKARQEYVNKFPGKEKEAQGWDDITFLNKVKVTNRGEITHAAILLLGKEESSSLITPSVAQMSWFLRNKDNDSMDYEHYGPPFILNVDRLFSRIRNLKIRHLPDGTLFPMETTQYDPWVLREALHNCIAHQDYELKGRINVVETPSAITFTNPGSFIPGSIETVIEQDAPQDTYRNPFLSHAMVNLNMIDTQGGGIKRMFYTQMKRFFPLPQYDITNPERVIVRIQGEILDENYTKILMKNMDLDLWTVILLDKVQKRIKIPREYHLELKKQNLVEGRYPNIFISFKMAAITDEKARYTRIKGLEKDRYLDYIIQHIKNHGSSDRKTIDTLLIDILPDILTQKQKKSMIHNLLTELRKIKRIRNIGTKRSPRWILCERQKTKKN
jgi:ATP-dependent DNA helicase RecG